MGLLGNKLLAELRKSHKQQILSQLRHTFDEVGQHILTLY